MNDKLSKPAVRINGEATVSYVDKSKCFIFNGVIGVGHPHLGEGVYIRSSRIQRIQHTPERTIIETLNTIYDCDEVVFNPEQEQAINLGINLAKSIGKQVALK